MTATLTPEHKTAMAEGRAQSRVIGRYLEGLEASRPRRGRKRTPESIQKRLARIAADLEAASPLRALQLNAERESLQAELKTLEEKVVIDDLEVQFVEVAKPYSERKGISWRAWVDAGVPPTVLERAGIKR